MAFDIEDLKRIIAQKQSRLDRLSIPEIWDRHTQHMECGEYREFKQSCVDDEIIIEVLHKQIPIYPVHKNRNYYSDDFCPVCGKQQKKSNRIMGKQWYCERCGQKLEWGGDQQ